MVIFSVIGYILKIFNSGSATPSVGRSGNANVLILIPRLGNTAILLPIPQC